MFFVALVDCFFEFTFNVRLTRTSTCIIDADITTVNIERMVDLIKSNI